MAPLSSAGCLLWVAVAAQQASLAGAVRDSVALEPVAFAHVTVSVDGFVRDAVSDRFGVFVVTGVPGGGTARVVVNALGYEPWHAEYAELPKEVLRVLMRPSPLALDSLSVEGGRRAGDPLSVSPSTFVVDSLLIRSQPVVLETDILRSVTISPSASASSDWASVPRIRGGAGEGTPILLDGVRLFNPFHLGGIMSAFNAEAISRVTLLTGSSGDSQPIGSVSGAIDITTRDGARDRQRFGGSLGLASARLSVEGPIGESTSYLVDARRSYFDLVLAAIKRLRDGVGFTYSLGDAHAKVTRDFGGVRRLSVTGYLNREGVDNGPLDESEFSRSASADWGNAAVSVHYRDRLGQRTFLDATAGHSSFNVNYSVLVLSLLSDPPDTSFATGRMSETRADVRVSHHRGREVIRGGVQATWFDARHAANSTKGNLDFLESQSFSLSPNRLRRLGAYANISVTAGDRAVVRGGLRTDFFGSLGTTLDPFAEFAYEQLSWKAWVSASRSSQALSSLRNEESIASSAFSWDLLAPVSRSPVLRSTEIAAGVAGEPGGIAPSAGGLRP